MLNPLEIAHKQLGWPKRDEIMKPQGSGPKVYLELARRKLETAISQLGTSVNVGMLTANSHSNNTEEPLAILCEFNGKVDERVLKETHRLVWSFSRSPMLVTVEPTVLKMWTCWKRPLEEGEGIKRVCMGDIVGPKRSLLKEDCFSISEQVARSLQWVELVSGNLFRNPAYSKYFKRNEKADQVMLEDLKELRARLIAKNLPVDIAHDLIARLIFIEFLFQRKDENGRSALNEGVLCKLKDDGILKRRHSGLSSILKSHEETYRFFRELDRRFNGDLFPGKGETPQEREAEWKAEKKNVTVDHLEVLREFVGGKMELSTGQMCLWRRYAFDVIPLEFISSIYEEFVSDKGKSSGAHYTPAHIVDFILDKVLPWNSKKWNVKVCDPSCGSGIFLVKSFQRLVYRWRKANPKKKLRVSVLRNLLENNIYGIDIDPHAVRVASFSLYLAMCDELEPRHIWQTVRFPRLRDNTLILADFFDESVAGFRTENNHDRYDLIVGNAPWGKKTETELAKKWAIRESENPWEISNHNIGPLFLVKAAKLTKRNGQIAMLQPASVMLFNREPMAVRFREKLFQTYKVEEIVNLSILRFGLFKNAISPSCVIVMRASKPDGIPLTYVCPKPTQSKEDDYRMVIEPYDVSRIEPSEAATDRFVWTALAWGGRRDLMLVKRLSQQSSLEKIAKGGLAKTRRGIGRGKGAMRQDSIVGMRLLDAETFPQGTFTSLAAEQLKVNQDPLVYAGHSTDMGAFQLPQMIFKLSWRKGIGSSRFRAAIVKSNTEVGPVLCSAGYVSVHMPEEHKLLLEAACLSFNSIVAVYYVLLSSGRFAFYIPSPNKEDFLKIPIPDIGTCAFEGIDNFESLDEKVQKGLGINEAEQVLVEDLFKYTLPDFKGGTGSPGREQTRGTGETAGQGKEQVLEDYCEYFQRVLRAAFGDDKKLSATIFVENAQKPLPVRLVAIHLEAFGGETSHLKAFGKRTVRFEKMASKDLLDKLKSLNSKMLSRQRRAQSGDIFYQRVARIYDTPKVDGKNVPTIFIIKPDQVRYWTRSMAMRDADEVALDVFSWREYPRMVSSWPITKTVALKQPGKEEKV